MNKLKVFYYGKRINPNLGWFGKKWARFMQLVRRALIILGAFGMVYLAFFVGKTFFPDTAYAVQEKVVTNDSLQAKIEELKTEVLDTLQACESRGADESDGLVTYDNNQAGTLKGMNALSFGQLQWKVGTVKHFVSLRDGKDITTKQAVDIALSEKEARSLASYAIFETTGGIHHWKNCAAKHDLVTKVEFIKKLNN